MEFPALSPMWLIAIGFTLLGLEVLSLSFYLIWFGLSALIVGLLSNFINFENGYYQLIAISTLSIILLFSLKSKLKELMKSQEKLEDEKERVGKIVGNQVSFEGTLWRFKSEKKVSDDDEVQIIEKKGNILIVN
ncbi:membrane protein implicated in regulation of membrane protease activity [Thiovulum sp. ES]|nr:membrane protein implicated in regulation of membrane protease activity [Thiovulum sp. ES]